MHHNINDPIRSNINPSKNPQKNKNVFKPNIKVYQSPNNNLIYNNNNNFNNYDIRVNKKNAPKEKIIEGDLNFNSKNIHPNKITTNPKPKKNRGKPTKSPLPIGKDYKLPNSKKFFNNNHHPLNGIYKPKTAIQRKNNFIGNININNVDGNNFNKNILKPNYLGINPNFSSNKTYNAFNVFKKKLERTQSPLTRSTGPHPGINFGQKGPIKQRFVSKSPILSKASIFNRLKMKIFSGNNNSNTTSTSTNSNNNRKPKKKTPIKNNNNVLIKPKLGINNKQNHNNINIIKSKGPTYIQAEFVQDSSSGGKININNVNVNNNINNNKKKNITGIKNNEEIKNFKPIYNSQNLKIESNNALLNIQPDNNKNNKEKEKNIEININLKSKNIESNDNTNTNKTNNNENNKNVNNIININLNNQNEQRKPQKKEENKKSNQRSQSTGITNPLQKEAKDKEKENKQIDKDKEIKEASNKIKKDKKKEKEENKEPEKEQSKYITKKIKDILPYTHVGFDGEEPKENNQDNYFIYKNFMNKKDYIYMSVCDGHGIEGHFVSDFMKEILPYDMSENLKFCNLMTESEKEREKIHQIIKQTFIIANEKLVENEEINSLFSGSTCVSVIYTPEKLIVPNIGDSRAVLGRLINKEKNEYKAIDLSRDHKPTEKDEAQRIIENDGRIQPFTEEGEFVGPERVWIKEEEVPGLAMTRSFGDRVAATVGVMSEPEIKEFLFEEGDKFMIIASDGIWEFISSQECVDIIKDYYDKNDLKGCCEYLYQESSKRWLKEEEVIDDTTLILVFFE